MQFDIVAEMERLDSGWKFGESVGSTGVGGAYSCRLAVADRMAAVNRSNGGSVSNALSVNRKTYVVAVAIDRVYGCVAERAPTGLRRAPR